MTAMTPTRLKVAHVINGMGLGGVPPIVQRLMTALPPNRYDLSLFCLKTHHDGQPGRDARLKEFVDAGVRVRFPAGRETPLQMVGRLCHWIDEDGIDILHTHSYQPNLFARTAAAVSPRPTLLLAAHYHNFYDDKWNAEGTLPLDRLLSRLSHALIACSDAVRGHMSERLEVPLDSIRVIPNGVDYGRFSANQDCADLRRSLQLQPGTRVIAGVGRISRQKASDDIVRAARIVCDARDDCVFVLAGADDDPFAPTVRQLVIDLGLERRVFFTGHLTDVAPLYALADVIVMPSRWEGFGLVLAEAMAAGRPLVTTAVGPIPEVVGKGSALMIQPDSPADLAAAVHRLLDDEPLARALGAQGAKRARLFSWDAAGARLDALYREMTQRVAA